MKQGNLFRKLVPEFIRPFLSSLRKRMITYEVGDTPHMAECSINKMREILAHGGVYLEYGAGGSTIFALKSEVAQVVSVESNKRFLAAVKRKAVEVNKLFTPFYVDIGPIKEWGVPINPNFDESWMRYPQVPWRYFQSNGILPDVILIDGRFRVACVLESLINLGDHECVFMIDDYFDRPGYHILEEGRFLTSIEIAGSMLVAKKSKDFDVLKAKQQCQRYYRDPD